jgi:ribonuclease VapC
MTGQFAVDSSVLVTILNGEPEADEFARILSDGALHIGWPTLFETRIWCLRHSPLSIIWLDQLALSSNTDMCEFDGVLEALATCAYDKYGKGRHPAQLNFGDCMAYAVARHRNSPLLFKGGDFSQTDVICHPASVTDLQGAKR